MKKELIKTVRSQKPEVNIKNRYLIKCSGTGLKSRYSSVENYFIGLNEIDIVLLSYFSNIDYHGKDLDKWKVECFNKDIFNGPLAFILPYLYDYDEFKVFDSGWDNISKVNIFWCDDKKGRLFREELPNITDIFDNIDELIVYIKEQMKIISKDIIDDEGVLIQPWEIDEAKEVLKQAGWNEQELRYLRWIGNDRGFGSCIEVPQIYADYIVNKFPNPDNKEKIILNCILDGLKTANQKCTRLGFNGPLGMCGTYIYRSDEDIIKELEIEKDYIVRMSDGRVYILHEGD